MVNSVIWITLAIGGVILLVRLNQRRRPALRRAHAAFDRLTQQAGRELEWLQEVFQVAESTVGDSQKLAARELRGDTLELGRRILEQVAALQTMSAELQRALSEGDYLLNPMSPLAQAANMITSSRYLLCLNLVEGQSVQLSQFPEDENRQTGMVSFEEFFSALSERTRLTKSNLDTFGKFSNTSHRSLEDLQETLSQIVELDRQLGQVDRSDRATQNLHRLFEVPSLSRKLIPMLELKVDEVEKSIEQDPVRMESRYVPELSRTLAEIQHVAEAVVSFREKTLPEVESARERLQQLGIATRWIERQLRVFSDQADDLFEQALSVGGTDAAPEFRRVLIDFGARVANVETMWDQLENAFKPAIESARDEIVEARETIASRLGLSPSLALRESGYSPDDEVQRADQQWVAARAALQQGNLELAQSATVEIEVEISQAHRCVTDSLLALDDFEGRGALLQKRIDQLQASLDKAREKSDQAERDYATESLEVDALLGCPSSDRSPGSQSESPKPDQSVGLLLQDLQQWLRDCQAQLNTASRLFEGGKILEGCNLVDLLDLDLGQLDAARDRLDLCFDRLEHLPGENRNRESKLLERINQLQQQLDQTADESIQANLVQLRSQMPGLDSASETHDKQNPVQDRERLNQLESQLEFIEQSWATEQEAHQDLLSALDIAGNEWQTAQLLVENSQQDGIPDSAQLRSDHQAVEDLGEQLRQLRASVEARPAEVESLEQRVAKLHAALARINGRLRGEIRAADRAAAALEQANQTVSNVTRWRGDYDIVVVGRPGVESLQQARKCLNDGQYEQVVYFSQEAIRKANHALAAAKAHVNRRRRMLARRDRR